MCWVQCLVWREFFVFQGEILKQLNHPNIVSFVDNFVRSSGVHEVGDLQLEVCVGRFLEPCTPNATDSGLFGYGTLH